MKKIISSALLLILVASAVGVGTLAYFDDTEVSTDNTFVAGSIDLEVGNTAYYDQGAGFVADVSATWGVQDLTASQVFFNFTDVKPGDVGYGYTTLVVSDNPSWLCSNVTLTASHDPLINDPESADGDVTSGDWMGELDDNLNMFFWADDGDGVYETGEAVIMATTTLDGLPQGAGNLGQVFDLIDATTHVFDAAAVGTPMAPSTNSEYMGQAWCFGDLTVNADDSVTPFTCDGTVVDNTPQGDTVVGDITFYAIQSRHNDTFECSSWTP